LVDYFSKKLPIVDRETGEICDACRDASVPCFSYEAKLTGGDDNCPISATRNSNQSADENGMKSLNRVPLFVGLWILVLFLAVLVYGVSSRGLRFG
jgi:hypothetical protein